VITIEHWKRRFVHTSMAVERTHADTPEPHMSTTSLIE
jgi:hypothetical protein